MQVQNVTVTTARLTWSGIPGPLWKVVRQGQAAVWLRQNYVDLVRLRPNTSYAYSVEGWSGSTLTGAVQTVTFTTPADVTPPARPYYWLKSYDSKSFTITLTFPRDDVRTDGFEITKPNGSKVLTSAQTYRFTDLSLTDWIKLSVVALDEAGNRSVPFTIDPSIWDPPTCKNPAIPTTPSNFSAIRYGRTVVVSWHMPPDECVAYFEVIRNSVMARQYGSAIYTAFDLPSWYRAQVRAVGRNGARSELATVDLWIP